MGAPHTIGFLWAQLLPYHMDRVSAAARQAGDRARIVAIGVASTSIDYGFLGDAGAGARTGDTVVLCPGCEYEAIGQLRLFILVVRAILRERINTLYIAGYEVPAFFFAALVMRAIGRCPVLMLDSKFDDKPRRLPLEALKAILLLPYPAAWVSGIRTVQYLHLLGFRKRPIVTGCDSVDGERIRRLGRDAASIAWEARPFVFVGRHVPKKNIAFLLEAYARYRAGTGDTGRRLRLCGSGPLEAVIRDKAAALGIADHVDILGAMPPEEVMPELARGLCLLLPSVEEQWGLVVNEAVLLGIPVIASRQVGAVDSLVSSWRNGFVLDERDVESWAQAMLALGSDRALWERLSQGAASFVPQADTSGVWKALAATDRGLPCPASR